MSWTLFLFYDEQGKLTSAYREFKDRTIFHLPENELDILRSVL